MSSEAFGAPAAPVAIRAAIEAPEAVPGLAVRSGLAALAADYLDLTKPRITGMVLVTTFIGCLLGAPLAGGLPPPRLLAALLGTALVTAGAQTLNQWIERRTDARMLRTRNRPLPSGRIAPRDALVFGWALAAGGLVLLWAGTNALTAGLGLFALLSYNGLYTPLKRVHPACTLVGAVPGAIPPVMGWVAARGTLDAGAWALFAVLFVWQLPHFYAIAWMYRDDYERGGLPMLSVGDLDGRRTSTHAVAWALVMIPASLAPWWTGVAGGAYAAGALLLGAGYLAAALALRARRGLPEARRLLLTSVVYLPFLLILMVACRNAPDPGVAIVSPAGASAPASPRKRVPDFSLTDRSGATVTRADLDGKVWIAGFIFTRCAGACPVMTSSMADLQHALADLPDMRLVSITVDPVNDTPEALSRYADGTGADRARWFFLTGPAEAVTSLAQDGFQLSAEASPDNPVHSQKLALVGRDGTIAGYYDGTDAEAVGRLAKDARAAAAPAGA